VSAAAVISVVIPVRDGAATLEGCLRSLQEETLAAGLEGGQLEIVVADNGSGDNSPEIAERRGCRVLRLPPESGVSAARNAGARAAGGEILVFTDADVEFRPGALREIRAALADPAVQGVLGIQDPDAAYPEFVSRFKNLWMAYSYLRLRGSVPLFYTAAAALRRSVFLTLGGFDEAYRRPHVEDTEFGQRLGEAGVRVEVRPAFRVDHRKRYTLAGLLGTDFRRSAGLARLFLRRRSWKSWARGNTSSVPTPVVAGVLLAAAALLGAPALLLAGRPGWALALAAGIPLDLALHGGFLRFLGRRGGGGAVLRGAGIVLLDQGWVVAGLLWGVLSFLFLGRRY
jgi:glycosyltransferase involved in cell wall biosynthesis